MRRLLRFVLLQVFQERRGGSPAFDHVVIDARGGGTEEDYREELSKALEEQRARVRDV